mgnify:FL=1
MELFDFKSLPVNEWPASDRKVWEAACVKKSPFKPAGLAAKWSDATRKNIERSYGTFLYWLKGQGQLCSDKTPAQRVTQQTFFGFMDAYEPGRAPLTVAARLRDIAYMVRAQLPPDGHQWATKIAHKLVNNAETFRAKHPRIVHPGELAELGMALMERGSEALSDQLRWGVVPFRDGLMIAALAYRPLRVRNLLGMQLGSTFFFDGERAHFRFEGSETKNGVTLEGDFPEVLTEPFAYYLKHVRPIYAERAVGADEGWLWLGRRGRCLTGVDVSTRVGKETEKHFGFRVNPHLFRDCAATAIAVSDSVNVGITRDILGHTTLASSQKYYNQATGVAASRRFQSILAKLRGKKGDGDDQNS